MEANKIMSLSPRHPLGEADLCIGNHNKSECLTNWKVPVRDADQHAVGVLPHRALSSCATDYA